MVVTQQHGRDGWQVVEPHRGRTHSSWADHVQRTGTLRVDRIREDVSRRRLNQKRRVSDERDDGAGAVERGRLLWRLVDPGRPGRPWFDQQPRNGGERLSRRTRGIDESLAVEVIARAFLKGHYVPRAGLSVHDPRMRRGRRATPAPASAAVLEEQRTFVSLTRPFSASGVEKTAQPPRQCGGPVFC